MAELVKDRLHFAVRQQRRLVPDRRGQIAADQPGMRGSQMAGWASGDEGVHPRSAAFVFAREPIRVKGRELLPAGRIFNAVIAHGVVPHRRAGLFDDTNPVEARHNFEQTVNDPVDGKVRAQFLFVEIVQFLAEFFRPIADIPGFEIKSGETAQVVVLAVEAVSRFRGKVFEKRLGAFAPVGHAVFDDQVGEVGVAKQSGLLAAQGEDFLEQYTVVALARRRPAVVRPPDLFADFAVVQIGHQRGVAGPLQGEPPTGLAFGFGAGARGGEGAGGQSGEIAFLFDHQFEFVRIVENVFGKLGGLPGQLHIDFVQSLLARFVEFGAMAAETLDRFLQEARLHRRQGLRLFRGAVGLDGAPEFFV